MTNANASGTAVMDEGSAIPFLDEMVCHGFSAEDIDADNWARFTMLSKVPDNMPVEHALRNRMLMEGYDITNAGVWLLAKEPGKFSPFAGVSCSLFMGTTKTRVLDSASFHGDILSMIDDAMCWVLSKINVAYIIESVQREERPELPMGAVREAVVNALVHRDYGLPGNVEINLHHDRLEIASPGRPIYGMTVADMSTGSLSRNGLLHRVLAQMRVVKKIAGGMRYMRESCREYGVDEPRITASESSVVVTFPRS